MTGLMVVLCLGCEGSVLSLSLTQSTQVSKPGSLPAQQGIRKNAKLIGFLNFLGCLSPGTQ